MRVFDETQTLPMPRRKTVIVPARRPASADGFAEATARPRAAAAEGREADRPGADSQLRQHASAGAATALAATAAGEAIAGKPGAITAKAINIKVVLDPSRFLEASGGSSLVIETADLLLRATLNPKGIRKARAAIKEHGPAAVAVLLQGQLGPHNTVQSAGLSVTVKSQKVADGNPV